MTVEYDVIELDVEAADEAFTSVLFRDVNGISGVRLFDVGQGDCHGLTDENNDVFCYIDFGGRQDHPDPSNANRSTGRLPVRYGERWAAIVLTHWDNDHFWTAVKRNVDAKNASWLVPRQHVSAQASRFAASLVNVRAFPERPTGYPLSGLTFSIGALHTLEIRKTARYDAGAVTEDRNLTGLSVIVEHRQPEHEQSALLPGDCPFDRLPLKPKSFLNYIAAYHHGSHHNWTPACTTFLRSATTTTTTVGFSFSRHNSYGHPDTRNYAARRANFVKTPDIRSAGSASHDIIWR